MLVYIKMLVIITYSRRYICKQDSLWMYFTDIVCGLFIHIHITLSIWRQLKFGDTKMAPVCCVSCFHADFVHVSRNDGMFWVHTLVSGSLWQQYRQRRHSRRHHVSRTHRRRISSRPTFRRRTTQSPNNQWNFIPTTWTLTPILISVASNHPSSTTINFKTEMYSATETIYIIWRAVCSPMIEIEQIMGVWDVRTFWYHEPLYPLDTGTRTRPFLLYMAGTWWMMEIR